MKRKKDDIRLSAFALDELSPEAQARLAKELKDNPELQAEVNELKQTSEALGKHFKKQPKQSLSDTRLAQIRKATAKPSLLKSNVSAYAALAAALLLGFAVFVTQRESLLPNNTASVTPEYDLRQDKSRSGTTKPQRDSLVTNNRASTTPPAGLAKGESKPGAAKVQNSQVTVVQAPVKEVPKPNPRSPHAIEGHGPEVARNTPKQITSLSPSENSAGRPNVASGVNLKTLGIMTRKPLDENTARTIRTDFPGAGGQGSAGSPSRPLNGLGAPANSIRSLGEGAFWADRARFGMVKENDFIATRGHRRSTFSADVDTTSYSKVRRYINQGQKPPVDAIQIGDMINHFRYNYPSPKDGVPFSTTLVVFGSPWNPANRLVRIGIKGEEMKWGQRPTLNLVFLVDVSESMASSEKLSFVKTSLKLIVDQMSAKDKIALVTYAGGAGVALPPTSGENKFKIFEAISRMEAGAATFGAGGIVAAYKFAQDNFKQGAVNRVVLATDGNFNIGPANEGELARLIQEKASQGVQLTVLGFGKRYTSDKTMELLANKGKGNYAYIDSLLDAKKALVKEVGATMITIAQDVTFQVEFNPELVGSYRLIGYETRHLAHQAYSDEKMDARDIGAGHTVTALYEVAPADKYTRGAVGDLRSSKIPSYSGSSDELLTLEIDYKLPGGKDSKVLSRVLKDQGKSFREAGGDFKFAAAVAILGMDLRDSKQKGSADAMSALRIAEPYAAGDEFRQDFLKLARRTANGLKPSTGNGERVRVEVALIELIVEGGLVEAEVSAVTRVNISQVRRCYEQFLYRNHGGAGELGFSSVISSNGRMGQVAISFDPFKDPEFSGCIADRLSAWRFPAPRGGKEVQVRGRFKFHVD